MEGVPVAYYDEFNIYSHIQSDLLARLPIQNVKWRTPPFLQSETVVTLNLNLMKPTASNTPHINLYNSPYIHVYFVHCEDPEVYKQVVKKQIKTWTESIRRQHEWLIIHVSSDQIRQRTSSSRGTGSVFEKIKQDFKKCVQIRFDERNNDQMWQEVFGELVNLIFETLTLLLNSLQEEIRRLDQQRSLPGFNFSHFFLLKEGMATLLLQVGLFDSSRKQYMELEALFYDVVNNQLQRDARSWSENLGAHDPMDDSANPLVLERKSYQDLLVKNCISIFDFRVYLFARQVIVLSRLQRPVDVLILGKNFMTSIYRLLMGRQDDFLESWMYSTCHHLVQYCREKFQTKDPAFLIFQAELLSDAKRQLDKLGIKYNYLSMRKAYEEDKYSFSDLNDLNDSVLTNQELKEALSSRLDFYKLYERRTDELREMYQVNQSHRLQRLMQVDLGIVAYNLQEYDKAIEIFTDYLSIDLAQLRSYSKWSLIDLHILMKLARAFEKSERTEDYLFACMLICINLECIQLNNEELEKDYMFYLNEIRKLTEQLEFSMKLNYKVDLNLLFEQTLTKTKIVKNQMKLVLKPLNKRLLDVLLLEKVVLNLYKKETADLYQFEVAKMEKSNTRIDIDLSSDECLDGNYVLGELKFVLNRIFIGQLSFLETGNKLIKFERSGSGLSVQVDYQPMDRLKVRVVNNSNDAYSNLELEVESIEKFKIDSLAPKSTVGRVLHLKDHIDMAKTVLTGGPKVLRSSFKIEQRALFEWHIERKYGKNFVTMRNISNFPVYLCTTTNLLFSDSVAFFPMGDVFKLEYVTIQLIVLNEITRNAETLLSEEMDREIFAQLIYLFSFPKAERKLLLSRFCLFRHLQLTRSNKEFYQAAFHHHDYLSHFFELISQQADTIYTKAIEEFFSRYSLIKFPNSLDGLEVEEFYVDAPEKTEKDAVMSVKLVTEQKLNMFGPSLFHLMISNRSEKELELTVALEFEQDCWIVGGRIRRQLKLPAKETLQFKDLILIPLKAGLLMTPSISVASSEFLQLETENQSPRQLMVHPQNFHKSFFLPDPQSALTEDYNSQQKATSVPALSPATKPQTPRSFAESKLYISQSESASPIEPQEKKSISDKFNWLSPSVFQNVFTRGRQNSNASSFLSNSKRRQSSTRVQ